MALNTDAKLEEKLTCAFKNDMSNFHKNTFGSLKLGPLFGPFIQSRKYMSIKFTEELCGHDNEEWCKIWRGLQLPVQNWHEEFDKFWPGHSKISKIGTLMGWFWPKYKMFWATKKITEELCLTALKIDANLKEN